MKNKQWLLWFLVLSIIFLSAFGTTMYITDPLLHYGPEKNIFSYYEYAEMYSNPGIAKHYEYDAVMVGTSMIQNTDVLECNRLFSCNMVRLPYSGGTCYNMKTILDVCFESPNDIKTVYWELDEFQLFSKSNEPRYPLPMYLYRNDHRQDLSYLLNLDIFYHYTINSILGTIKGIEQPAARQGNTLFGNFSKASALAAYDRIEEKCEKIPADSKLKSVEANLNQNIIPLLEDNPDTEFVFFFVPFSMLYWDNEIQQGTLDSTMCGLKYTLGRLLEYNNVRIYFYHNQWTIAEDLDNYKDYSHYGSWINSYMTQAIAKDEGRLTKENYVQTLQEMQEYLDSYDFEAILTAE